MFFVHKTKKKNGHNQHGFTLIELVVTVGMITLITGIVMTKYSSFNSTILLKSQAYELALDIRQAQVFGVSVGGVTNSYHEAFGIYIDLSNPNSYVLFQDAPGTNNLHFDVGEQIGDTYILDPRFEILQICTTISTVRTCDSASSVKASVAFKRPDFDARMWTNTVSNPNTIDVVIAVVGDSSITRQVSIYASGQISVQ